MTPLKIIKLEVNNIMRLKALNITVDGRPVVLVTGDNDQGKTSVLNSIAFTLGGKDLIADVPIRKGSSKGKAVVDLGEFKVTRTFSALGGTQLIIEDKSGKVISSPQTLLDKLCSKIGWDPLAFVREKPEKQVETLRKLVGLDFTLLDSKRKAAYDDRTIANRELASAKARAAECEVDPETPDEEVSVAALMKQLEEVQAHNKRNQGHRQEVDRLLKRVESGKDVVLQVTREVDELKAKLAAKEKELKSSVAELEERGREHEAYAKETATREDKDETAIRNQVNAAGTINAKVRDKKNYAKLLKEVETAQMKTDALTETIEEFDKEKTDAMSAAKFPLPGLSFDDTGILLNDVPFTQGSQARQLQAAVAIGIAMNPTIRVILIRDASLLDKKSMEAVAKMAADNDCQFWLEVVGSEDPAAIVIENGEVKEEVASE